MLDAHLVQETEFQEPGARGRPAIGLILDTDAWHYLAIRLHRGDMTMTLRDLSSRIIVEDTQPLPDESMQPLLTSLVEQVDAFLFATSTNWSA